MIDLMSQVPKIKATTNFEDIATPLTELEINIISRVNGLISFGEMSERLGIPPDDLSHAAVKFLQHDIIFFDNPQIKQDLLQQIETEEVAETPESQTPEGEIDKPDHAVQGAVVKSVKSGEWHVNSIFPIIIKHNQAKVSGILRVFNKKGENISLFFEEGELIQVQGNPFDPGHCLGRILQRAGRLTKDKVIESLKRTKVSGRMQGEELIRMGVVRRTALPEILLKQIEFKLRNILIWKQGRWEFYAVPELVTKVNKIDIALPRLLFNVIWKYYDFERNYNFDRQLKSKFIGLNKDAPFPAEALALTENVETLWEVMENKDNPFQRLVIVSKMNPDSLAKVVWALNMVNMVLVLDSPRISARDIRIKKLSERLRFISRENHFDVVGVHWTSNSKDVKEAYKNSHDEQVQLMEDSTGTEAALREQLIRSMVKGYEVIKSKDTRDQYRKDVYDDLYIEYTSDLFRMKGESYLFTKEDNIASIREMENALEIWDKNEEYYCVLGMAIFMENYPRNTREYSEGRTILLKGYRGAQKTEIANICMGIMYREEKKNVNAIDHFERVLKINKRNRFAKVLIEEIKTGKGSEDRDQAIKEFLERETDIDKKFNKKFDKKKKKKSLF